MAFLRMFFSLHSSFLASLALFCFIIPCIFAAPLQAGPSPGQLLIDVFDDPEINALGEYHGGSGIGQFDDEEQRLSIATDNVDGKNIATIHCDLQVLSGMLTANDSRLLRHQSKRDLH
jgi:hypothetical protein